MRLGLTVLFAATIVLPDSTGAATPSGRIDLRDGRRVRSFEVAADELSVRDLNNDWRLEPVSPGNLESSRARLAAAGPVREISLVLYPSGAERTLGSRRVLSRTVVVETRPDVDPATLPRTVEGGSLVLLPAFSRRRAVYAADDPFGSIDLAQTLRRLPGVLAADPELGRHHLVEYRPNDTYFGLQWHLEAIESQNGGTDGIDVGAVPAWDKYRGAGIIIGVVDDGLEATHLDLAANVRTDLGHDYLDGDTDPSPKLPANAHGTSVGGLIAAVGDNHRGVAGVAYEAKLAGIRIIDTGTQTDSKVGQSLAHRSDIIQIKNNSWGPPKAYEDLADYGPLIINAVEDGVATGRNGLGSIFVFSSGNFGVEGDDVNYASLKNRPDVIPVGAVALSGVKASYSTPGAPLLVCTPGGDLTSRSGRGIITTDRTGTAGNNTSTSPNSVEHGFDIDYTQYFNGTSAAAPLVSGVVALVLQANPRLGWRDVQEILLRTATKNSPTDPDWRTNGAGFSFNHAFGAGIAHAGRATALAETWKNLPAQTLRSRQSAGLSLAIPDNNTNGVTHELAFSGPPIRVEHVQVTLDIVHPSRGELSVTLISPSGMTSRLAQKHKDTNPDYPVWTFLSRRHWGELSTGTWKVQVTDTVAGKTGVIKNVLIELLGASQETLTFAGNSLFEVPGLSNGNGGADPGETLAEVVTLRNATGSDLANVQAAFATDTPGVVLLNNSAVYPTLPADRTAAVNLQYKLPKTMPCGTVLSFQQIVTTGTLHLTNIFSRTVSTSLSTVRTTNVFEGHDLIPLAIPDLKTSQASNQISLATNPLLESVAVALRLDHTAVGDLEISLIHPDQTEVPLMLHRGGDNPNLGVGTCGSGESRTLFSDAAPLSVSAGAVPFNGAFRPEQPLGKFAGKPANGAWVLRLTDSFDEDSGTLLCWSLITVTRTTTTECKVYNLGPTVIPLSLTTDFGRSTNGLLQGTDGDGDPITFSLVTPPVHGKVQLGVAGSFTYIPTDDYSGADAFSYKANDGYVDSPAATVSIVVKPPPAPPSLRLGPVSWTPDHLLRIGYQRTGSGSVTLQTSADLVNWLNVTVFTDGGATEYIEPTPSSGARYYRLR